MSFWAKAKNLKTFTIFITEVHSNYLYSNKYDANEGVKQVFCRPLKNGFFRVLFIYILHSNSAISYSPTTISYKPRFVSFRFQKYALPLSYQNNKIMKFTDLFKKKEEVKTEVMEVKMVTAEDDTEVNEQYKKEMDELTF